ncbi:hypothetical protein Kpol_392p11 [Vanderwaltozyma polyspora DSM 70294]|uniref:Trafficking protein particle complex III-specific subunit 85 n=1 Tax=Vanderwaltozyma polyspora (strain ATCC 22028 / DSM 70294 / BCRC 21397 / CBS 2163 / NBRC 10782 / NRRL Y-8283 / UCD 57-17) TaxID=436907 RepID=A7TRS2_VANPO|nr:uncharacterized protein Kpol_392p11 [Vanderwaltozyma polyspora DSM 70294]EDO15044.1 hypothetical protein Kpol_392p11 [Vanderwaltozyma polyspora DSM 70294]
MASLQFSYENYMNLVYHLDRVNEPVPQDISKRIVSNAIAPVITVMSTSELDQHVQDSYNIDSLYLLMRYFGGCISDRDQANEYVKKANVENTAQEGVNDQIIEEQRNSNTLELPKSERYSRSRSNSLFQRDSTQSHYIRFTKPIEDLINSRDSHDMLFDYHSLEVYLEKCLSLIDKNTNDETDHKALKMSLFHRFFSSAISSTTYLSPYESFNHPLISLVALDISKGQNYEDARDLLIKFKNQNNAVEEFPPFMSTNDILLVFLLCYDGDSEEQKEICQDVVKKLKKQLFAESLMLPLWNKSHSEDVQVELHQPAMSSLDEMLYFFERPSVHELPLNLINTIYDLMEKLVVDLMIPFMQRKISFWEETILQPRKSLFHGNKLFRKFMNRSSSQTANQYNNIVKDSRGNEYFTSSSPEFLLRKLADWSMMISDFKTAYSTYETLISDLEAHPKYLASCLEWCAISILMGAQNIVTAKMIKNDVNPLIERSLDTYEQCSILAQNSLENDELLSEPVRSYETRCMLLTSELFLSLNDTWTSTPYALSNLETILAECKLGICSQIMIWERLSDCYNMRTDPRIRHRVETVTKIENNEGGQQLQTDDIVSKGLARKRKAAFFRLLAAKKWAEQKQWRQVSWCLRDVEYIYDDLSFSKRPELIYQKLKDELNEERQGNKKQ